MIDLKELKKLISCLKNNGVSAFKCQDFELTLDASPAPPKRTRSLKSGITVPVEIAPLEIGPTAEELLFWSAGGSVGESGS